MNINSAIKYICLIMIVLLFGCYNVPQIKKTEELQYVYQIPNCSKNDIFDKANVWIAESFGSYKSVVEMKDRDTGIIVLNGLIDHNLGLGSWIHCRYTMTIDIKDNKIRITFRNIRLRWKDGFERLPYETEYEQDKVRLKSISISLYDALSSKIIKKTDEW